MPIVALAGNPNAGKTTIFNALTGSRHHVGNWPGVTVERRSGEMVQTAAQVEVVDLPGTYSLSARSEDEWIASSFLADPTVDLIINVLDASNLERNLYLSTQLLELGKPIVFVLNMLDDAGKAGISFDLATLELLLGGPVIPTVGNREEGMDTVREVVGAVLAGDASNLRSVRVHLGEHLEHELAKLQETLARDEHLSRALPGRLLALQLLERHPEAEARVRQSHARDAIEAQVLASLAFLEQHLGADGATLVAEARYGFARGLVHETVRSLGPPRASLTDKLDAVLTHRWLGIPIFLGVMTTVYAVTFLLGKYPQEWIGSAVELLRVALAGRLPQGELASLLLDGIIPGVGAVVVFLPVILLLMGCIAFLEDTGYMARAAFIMDRLMHLFGLHGKSFIPLVMGTGCNVPAVLATRTIEAREDRLITILVSPLVSCSARLQIYILLAGAFFPPFQAALAIVAMHLLGFGLAMLVGRLLRWSLFRRSNLPFVMELPPYRMPVLRSTLAHMWEKGSVFLSRAGTTILVGATLVWFVSHYPGLTNRAWTSEYHQAQTEIAALGLPPEATQARLEALELTHQGRIVNSSLAARFGKVIQPLLAPILDPDRTRPDAWKDGVALTAGFVAKEIVVSTMAVVHQADPGAPDPGTGSSRLVQTLRNRSGLTPLTALAFMAFTLIYTPCIGTLSIVKKETGSWGWTAFTVGYGLGLAWLVAYLIVALGRASGWG